MSSSPTETIVDVTMPQMGVSVAEGTVVEWRVGVGDPIEADQTICDISTDKIDTEVPSPVSGVVTEILVHVEETVPVGEVLARIAVDGEAARADSGARSAVARADGGGGAGANRDERRERRTAPRRASRRSGRHYSPVVQRIAAEHRVDLSRVEGSGRGGRVRKQDVLAFIEASGREALAGGGSGRGGAGRGGPAPHREPVPARAGAGSGLPHPLADATPDRRAHEALARDGGDVHDLDRGRHVAGRAGAGEARRDRARVRRQGDDRRAARAPGAQRVARGRAVHRALVGQPRDRGLARRRRADRAGRPRRA